MRAHAYFYVSIHAPRTGRDLDRSARQFPHNQFQSTRPARGATSNPQQLRGKFCLFQSTRPARGATFPVVSMGLAIFVSIHAPRTGRDLGHLLAGRQRLAVSIHAPRTGRDNLKDPTQAINSCVSIHAPRTGRDLLVGTRITVGNMFQSTRPARGATTSLTPSLGISTGFNPRAPHGARPGRACCQGGYPGFQSTRPARGATRYSHPIALEAVLVSIHAPRTGRDGYADILGHNSRRFNPRAPHGARPWANFLLAKPTNSFNPRAPHGARPACLADNALELLVSIHAPRTGRDDIQRQVQFAKGVSIHAPRTGRDVHMRIFTGHCFSFNPRAPHGARQLWRCLHNWRSEFQSTRPARGATQAEGVRAVPLGFQSTRPARGATW